MAFYGRGKNKVQNCYNLKDQYEDYIKDKHPDSLYYVSMKDFDKICKMFYQSIVDYILEKNGTFKLPYGLGELRVVKRQNKRKKNSYSVDWELTQKHGKYIYHLNEHTSGCRYSFYWSKCNNSFKNKYLYRLVLTRQIKRRLAKMIKSGKYDYVEV